VFGQNQATLTVRSKPVIMNAPQPLLVGMVGADVVAEALDLFSQDKAMQTWEALAIGTDGLVLTQCQQEGDCPQVAGARFTGAQWDYDSALGWLSEHKLIETKAHPRLPELAGAEYTPAAPERKEQTPEGVVQRMGDILTGNVHRIFTMIADDWLIAGYLSQDERLQMSAALGVALDTLRGEAGDLFLRQLPYGMMFYSNNTAQETLRLKEAVEADAEPIEVQSLTSDDGLEQRRRALALALEIESIHYQEN